MRHTGRVDPEEGNAAPVEPALPRWAPWLLGAVAAVCLVVMILLVR